MLDNLNSAMAATAMLRVSDAKDWVLLATLAALAATLVFGFLAARQRSRLLLRIEQGLDRFSNADFTPAIEDSVAEPLVSLVRRFNALGAPFASLANWALNLPITRQILSGIGITPKRAMPAFAPVSLALYQCAAWVKD